MDINMDLELLHMLVCPASGGKLALSKDGLYLCCALSSLAYPLKDDIPVLIQEEALPLDELDKDNLPDDF